MKRIFALIAALALASALMTGCSAGGSKDWKDGTYRATFSQDSHGWTEYLEVTVKDGKITAADYDATNSEDPTMLKSQDQAYEDSMKGAGSAVGPMEFYKEYEQKLIDQQKGDVDAVAGATNSGKNMKILFDALQKPMIDGTSGNTTVTQTPEG